MMRLKVEKVVSKATNMTINIDGDIPIVIDIHNSVGSPPLYWRVGNGKKSLLEIAVLPENGFLSAVSLIIIDPFAVRKVNDLSIKSSYDKEMLPVFNLNLWGEISCNNFSHRFFDSFDLDIDVALSSNSILLAIGNNDGIVNWIKCGENFYLGTNDNREISGLFLENLTSEEVENFLISIN